MTSVDPSAHPSTFGTAKARQQRALPDLRALEAFMTVCEAGSMSLAAERLGVSQSAISQLVKSLEATYGMQLLDREMRPALPNRAGRVMLELSGDLLSQARGMAEQLRQRMRQDHAHIRLGCVDSFAATVGPGLIQALAGGAGDLQLWSGLTPALRAQLLARELDLAVCTELPTKPFLKQHGLLSERWLAVFPRGARAWQVKDGQAPAASGVRQKLQQLPLPLVRYTQRSVIGQQIERFLHHLGLALPQRYAFDATDPLLSMVAAGLGWAITTPLCLWQSRAWLAQIQVAPLPAMRLGQRDFHLLCREPQWAGTSEEIAGIARATLARDVVPALRRAMPSLPRDAITIQRD